MASRPLLVPSLALSLTLCPPCLPGSGLVRAQGVPGVSAEEANVLQGETLFREAKTLSAQGNYRGASDKLRQITRMSFPGDPAALELMAGAHRCLAEVLLLQRNVREAESVANRGLQMTGSDQRPGYLRADFYELLGQAAEARGDRGQAQEFRRRAQDVRSRAGR